MILFCWSKLTCLDIWPCWPVSTANGSYIWIWKITLIVWCGFSNVHYHRLYIHGRWYGKENTVRNRQSACLTSSHLAYSCSYGYKQGMAQLSFLWSFWLLTCCYALVYLFLPSFVHSNKELTMPNVQHTFWKNIHVYHSHQSCHGNLISLSSSMQYCLLTQHCCLFYWHIWLLQDITQFLEDFCPYIPKNTLRNLITLNAILWYSQFQGRKKHWLVFLLLITYPVSVKLSSYQCVCARSFCPYRPVFLSVSWFKSKAVISKTLLS